MYSRVRLYQGLMEQRTKIVRQVSKAYGDDERNLLGVRWLETSGLLQLSRMRVFHFSRGGERRNEKNDERETKVEGSY